MEMHYHSLSSLFEQLGLASESQQIIDFIDSHRHQLSGSAQLHQAEFWNPAQARFLQQAKQEDADWAEVVDQLDAMLRR